MENINWQPMINLIKKAFQDNMEFELLHLLLTPDECESISTRVKIIEFLLSGSINQRELKHRLGTGIATITRGSNSLKSVSPEFRQWLINNVNTKR